jgi:branched-subunit amino acid transport protein
MTGMTTAVTVVVLLALGTYAMRLAGIVLADRIRLPEPVRRLLPLAAVALLAALAVTAAFTEAGRVAGVARPAGVLVGVVLAWRPLRPGPERTAGLERRRWTSRPAPFAVVVIAAAATAAGLRLLGLP